MAPRGPLPDVGLIHRYHLAPDAGDELAYGVEKMSLASEARVEPCAILSALGAGGMGEVCRGRVTGNPSVIR